jgi:hypothetical protein
MANGNIVVDLGAGLQAGAQKIATEFFNYSIPVLFYLVGVAILILIGWVIGKILKQIVIRVLQTTRVDQWIDEQNLSAAIGGKEVSALAGSLVKWYVIVLFLAAATGLCIAPSASGQCVKLAALENFFTALVAYIPKVLGGIVVFVGGLLLGRYAKNAVEITQHKMKHIASTLAEGIIVLFTGILALTLILTEKTMETLAIYLDIFISPFIKAFAVVAAVLLGIVCLMAFKEDLRKMATDLKKSLK